MVGCVAARCLGQDFAWGLDMGHGPRRKRVLAALADGERGKYPLPGRTGDEGGHADELDPAVLQRVLLLLCLMGAFSYRIGAMRTDRAPAASI